MSKARVLFLCTGNSARSQMAEALLRKYAGDHFEVYSAGLEPKGLNPYTVKVLEEIGVDTSQHYSKTLDTFMGKVHFGYLITVCSNAEENCPIFPGMGMRMHWPFEDPAAFVGSEEETLQKFREIRDQIDARVREWLKEMNIPVN
ncbi:protein tyrosine phosphatase [Bellilinea caldifistulae]|uniref:Protein tyrosine phosphatase n=1 Tax=Bellilinea caldifistulae TaxID=360411 RepID=A0A0P6X1N5_9CHLR|nr:arsenate reductase ArsC [Bellilinea caldifistulae]KPL76351.1 protein tyrosine phosphatase [Bellilinea caldifistulae]GAP12036.1 protein tyrosine phosphatase [Bellilinea caldifistulae]